MTVGTPKIVGTSCSVDSEGHVHHQLFYEVSITDPVNEDAWLVTQAVYAVAPITYACGTSTHANAFIQGIGQVSMRDAPQSRLMFSIPVSYSTKPLSSTNGTGGSSPLDPFTTPINEPWKFSGTLLRLSRLTNRDRNDDPIDIQGSLELKAVEIPAADPNLHMEGYTPTISLQTWAELFNPSLHCNSATIWGLTPRQLLLANWTWDVRKYGSGSQCIYHVIDWEIKFEGWTERYVNASKMKRNPAFNGTLPISDDNKLLTPILSNDTGLPVSEPHPLDAFGEPCAFEDAPLNEREVIPEFDFLTLGFPTTLPGPFV